MDIDARGPRFGALISTIVLAAVLATGSAWLLAAQTLVFAIGAVAGLRYAPYGLVYRFLVRPWIGRPRRTEPEAAPRFAQGVGMVTAAVGVIGYATGFTALGVAFTAMTLAATFLNAAFGICLGCHMYLFIRKMKPASEGKSPA